MAEREPDDGLGRIPLTLPEQFIYRGVTEVVFGAGVEVSQRTKDVVAGQPRWDGLRHGVRLPGGGLTSSRHLDGEARRYSQTTAI
jgi:hypothetical protein